MTKKSTNANKQRGLATREAYNAKGIKRPMALVEAAAPKLNAKDKQLIRLYLLGLATKNMPERLMAIADKAVELCNAPA